MRSSSRTRGAWRSRPSSGATTSVPRHGIGILEEHLDNVFAEFRPMDATVSLEYRGTGLGLSITKKFVELHGGRIWVESTVGKGSTFWFEVPVRLADGRGA